jgi:hypothetical protein
MKIAERQHSVKIDGDVSVNEFGFIFNGKMVKLLSDNLYNDKIAAIVRELSTNAYDSHVEAGTQDKAFDVHLPTYDEPYFYVRDYGTGMSPERVDTIYRFYGASDRTDSNEFTGGMGLGSKVPFCYNTQTFTVDSWYDGVHTCYSCFIGENGKPNIATMSRGESDEPDGVMIKLQVRSNDCSNFKYAAENIYSVFPVVPKFIGAQRISVNKPQYVLSANDNSWKLRKNDGDSCRVIMGNVAYPVQINDANITASQRAVINSCFDLFVEVGSVSVDIGREGLSYDNRTRTRIGNMLNKVVSDYNQRIKEEIDKCKNLWEARRTFAELYNKAEIRVMDGSKITYNGEPLFSRSGYHTVNLDDHVSVKKDNAGNIISQPIAKITSISIGWRSSKYDKNDRINTISAVSNVKFFENDLTIGSFVRAADIARKESCSVLLFKFNDDAARKTIVDAVGCDESYFPKISTIPSPTVRESGGPRGSCGRVVSFDQSISDRHNTVSDFWDAEQNIDFEEDGGLYVEFNRFQFRNNSGLLQSPNSLAHLLKLAKQSDIAIPKIYGIKTADIHRVKNQPQWVSLFDFLSKEIAKELPTLDITKIKYYQNQLTKVCRESYYDNRLGVSKINYESCVKIAKVCTTKNDFTNFVDAISKAQDQVKNEDKVDSMLRLAGVLNVPLPKYSDFTKIELDKMEQAVYNKYVMLGFLGSDNTEKHSSVAKIAAYIDSVS